jgi:pyruvate dehydrogenase E2 component (dihydrolipoamide acetyltransferase)
MAEIVMPRLSDSMEEGMLARWLVADGDRVERGQELAEIESDKAMMAYASEVAGIVRHVVAEGETVPVGTLIAHVLDGDEEPAPAVVASAAAEPAPATEAVPAPAAERPPRGARPKASPVARRVAREAGIALEGVAGSGPQGRIVRADVEALRAAPAAAEPARSAPLAATSGRGEVSVRTRTSGQAIVAKRMALSRQTIPHFDMTACVDMTGCVALRAQLKALDLEATPSFNDMIVRAVALALRRHPEVNSAEIDGRVETYSRVNVGVAVASAGALVVPTVFDADERSLSVIAAETRRLAGQVREAAITPAELGGGTFTVSNLGMYGIEQFGAVINPPQAAILAVGALAPELRMAEGAVVERQILRLTLTSDHRVLDGAQSAAFLASVREILERPVALLL